MAKPEMSYRIDHFAQVAMSAMLNKESTQQAIIAEERDTGVDRHEILARMAYEVAQYMEAEALKQPDPP